VLASAVAGSLVLPRAAAAFVALTGVVWIGWLSLSPAPPKRLGLGPLGAAVLVFAAYCGLTALWAVAPSSSALKVGWLVVLVLIGCAVTTAAAHLDESASKRLRWAIAAAYAIGLAYVGIEVLTGGKLLTALLNAFTVLRPADRKHFVMSGADIARINPYVFNRNMGALTLLLWPALAATAGLARSGAWRWGAVLLFVVALIIAARSEHESSAIAIAASGMIFAVASLAPRIGRGLVLAGWVTAVVFVIPIVMLAYGAGLQKAGALPETARARFTLWNYTAEQTLRQPLLGVGVASTKYLDEKTGPAAPKLEGEIYAQRTGRHAHNVYLQAWYELGAIGVALFLTAGVLLWRAILHVPSAGQPYALAAFTAAMVVGSFTWGLWQEWYLSLFTLALVCTAIATKIPETRSSR
jgi:O-antigen ligase